MDIKLLISRTLRWGISIACLVALVGGALFLARHGGEVFNLAQYQDFSYAGTRPVDHATLTDYTTLGGILNGFANFTAVGWIQTGVILLILTPIMRVFLSLLDFIKERDWLYAIITAVVLAVIISNSLGGTK